MRRLAAGLGFLCVVLLLLAFDEGQATRAVVLGTTKASE